MGKKSDGSLIFDTAIDTKDFQNDVKSLEKMTAKSFAAIGTAAAAAFGTAIKVGGDFEEAMSSVDAISMATSEEYDMLAAAARKMGEETKYSATEAANALEYLSLAGYTAGESVEALPKVLNLAAAGGMDLAYASDLLTDSMAVMGLGIQDMDNFSDQLAMAASKSNTNVAQLGEAVLIAGGQAKLAGMSVDQMNTALGILADKGIKGSEGGTALRNTLKNLYTPTTASAKVMAQLGISTADANGKLIDAQTVLQNLKKKLDNLSEADKMSAMGSIFDTRTIAAANALLDDCGDRWNELSGYLNNCDGAAEQMAKTMNDNLKGDMVIMQSAAESLGITFYETFSGKARSGVQAATSAINGLTDKLKSGSLEEPLKLAASGMGMFAAATAAFKGAAVIADLTMITNGVQNYTAATKLGAAAQSIMNSTLLANPYVAAAAALAALTAGFLIYSRTHKTEGQKILDDIKTETEARQQEHQEYMQQRAERANNAAANAAEIDYVGNLASELQKLADINGVVQEKDTARAQFILNELNTALGTEYTMTGNQIARYNELCSSIDEVIAKKKYQILAEAQLEEYTNAVQNQAQRNLELADALTKVKEAQEKVQQLSDTSGEIVQGLGGSYQLACEQLEEYQKQYSLIADEVKQINDDISTYEAAQTASLEGNTQKAIKILQDYSSRYSDTYSRALSDCKGNKAEEEKVIADAYAKALTDLANYAEEYKNGTEGYTEQGLLILQDNAVKMGTEANNIGLQITNGVLNGLSGFQRNVKPVVDRLFAFVPEWARNMLDIRSPSRVMRDDVGKYISLGVAAGIEENSDSVKEAMSGMLEKLDYQRKFDIISEDEYYTELEKLRDRYFAKGTKEWLEYTQKIYDYQKSESERQKKEIQTLYDDISNYASDKLEAVQKKQQAFSKKLQSYISLYNKNTVQIGDTSYEYYSMHDIKQDAQVLSRYFETLSNIKERLSDIGVSPEILSKFFEQVDNMGIEEGTMFASSLLNANIEDLTEYINAFGSGLDLSDKYSSKYYAEDVDNAWNDSIQNMRTKLEEAGYEIPEGFYVSGSISAQKFGSAFIEELDKQLEEIRSRVAEFNSKLSAQVNIGQSAGGSVTYNNQTAYNISAADSSDTVEQIRRYETIKRLSGVG